MLNPTLIERSLELVAERVGDPGELIYRRLFESHPELEELFVRDTSGSVRGEMLQRAFETLLDVANNGQYGKGLIATEWVNHQNLGVAPDRFGIFFNIMVDTIRQVHGKDWTAETAAAWQSLITRVDQIIAATSSPA